MYTSMCVSCQDNEPSCILVHVCVSCQDNEPSCILVCVLVVKTMSRRVY